MNTSQIVRLRIGAYACLPEPTRHTLGKTGVCVELMERELAAIDPAWTPEQIKYSRRLILGWLFTPNDQAFAGGLSTNALSPQQIHGLWRWIGPARPPGVDDWLTRPEFRDELKLVLACAVTDIEFSRAAAAHGRELTIGQILAEHTDPERGYVVNIATIVAAEKALT